MVCRILLSRVNDVKKFIHGNFLYPIPPTEKAVREHFKHSYELTLYGFESMETAHALVDKFPSFIFVNSIRCTSTHSFEEYGILSHRLHPNNFDYVTYGVKMFLSRGKGDKSLGNKKEQNQICTIVDILKWEKFIS